MPIGEHFSQRRVEFHETDRAGIIHYSNYFKYADTAVAEFFRALNLPGPLTRWWGGTGEEEVDWPYVSVSCDFQQPVQFDDLLQIHIWIKRIGTKSLTFRISFKKDTNEVAQGQLIVVCCKSIQGQPRSVEIPVLIRQNIIVPEWCQTEKNAGEIQRN